MGPKRNTVGQGEELFRQINFLEGFNDNETLFGQGWKLDWAMELT